MWMSCRWRRSSRAWHRASCSRAARQLAAHSSASCARRLPPPSASSSAALMVGDQAESRMLCEDEEGGKGQRGMAGRTTQPHGPLRRRAAMQNGVQWQGRLRMAALLTSAGCQQPARSPAPQPGCLCRPPPASRASRTAGSVGTARPPVGRWGGGEAQGAGRRCSTQRAVHMLRSRCKRSGRAWLQHSTARPWAHQLHP